jgi:hypothetical protein
LIKFSGLIPIFVQNGFNVAVETKAATDQVSSVLFHPRLRLTMSMILSPSSDALSKPAIAIYTLLFFLDVVLPSLVS